jgi:drug/metabolite transporter (DMT)-like permease
MLTAILGLCTALSYGAADFFAALAARRMRVVIVTCAASLSGLILLLLLLPIVGASFSQEAIFWGFLGGLSSIVALLTLYASLALGPISIVSPLGALLSAIVPAAVGVVLLGERFTGVGWVAIAMALIAVVLVGFVPGDNVQLPKPRAIVLAMIAGAGIGLAVVSLARSPQDSGIGPIIVMRTTAFVLLGVIVLFSVLRKSATAEIKHQGPKLWVLVASAGVLDATANIFFTLASRSGSLTVTGVLTALYPLGTILLARLVLKEKVALVQKIGIALTLVASLMLALAK